MHRRLAFFSYVLSAVLMSVLFLIPLAMVVRGGFFEEGRFTLRFLSGVFRNPVYAEGLLNSVGLAVGTLTLVTLIALPLAWISDRFDYPGKKLLGALILVPMILPPFVGAIGIQQILGPYGAFNAALGLGPVDWLGRGRYAGVVLLQSLGLYPIMYLNVTAALANIDPAMEEAAENLGCRGWRRFHRITRPLIMPGYFAGAALVFIWSFTDLGTPLMLSYTRCAPVQIFDALKEIGANPFPYALVFVMLMCSLLLYAAVRFLFGRRSFAMQSKASMASSARRLHGASAWAAALPFFLVMTVALTPHAGVLFTSITPPGGWYRSVLPEVFTAAHYIEALGHEMTLQSIRNSLLFSALAVLFSLGLGVSVSYVVARSDLPGRQVLDALAMLPLAVPGLVMAFGYLALSSHWSNQAWVRESPFWQPLLDVRTNPTFFLVIAYGIRRLPYMVRSSTAGLQQTSVTLEEAAANLGAGPLTTLRKITVPLISAQLLAGALLVFAFSMLEVSDSLMLAQRKAYYPITKTIFELFQLIGTGPNIASALGMWAMGFLAVTILGTGALLGKRMGALFRV